MITRLQLLQFMSFRCARGTVASLVLLALSGCGTVSSHVKGLGCPYGGLQYDLQRITCGEEWRDASLMVDNAGMPILLPRSVLWILDVPLFFAADTLCLPVDTIWLQTTNQPCAEP